MAQLGLQNPRRHFQVPEISRMQLAQPMPRETGQTQTVQNWIELPSSEIARVERFSRAALEDPLLGDDAGPCLQVSGQNRSERNDSLTGNILGRVHFPVPDIAANREGL